MYARGHNRIAGAVIGAVLATQALLPAQAQKKPPVTPIEKITTEYTGKRVTVEGKITATRGFKAGTRFTLEDASGVITVVLFDRSVKPATKLDVGARVGVTGRVDFYKNEAQIVPANVRDLSIVQAAPPPRAVSLADALAAGKGAQLTVGGVLVEASAFSAGVKFALDDGTARLRAVVFDKSLDRAGGGAIATGATVTVTGRFDEYNGELELVVDRVDGVLAPDPGKTSAVREYALGAINGNDHNAQVRVSGDVVELKDAGERGVEFVLKDESGAQLIRLPRVIANRVAVAPGQKLTVIGRVRAARASGVRIEVALPGDVIVVTVL
jgi:RecJ-like exonuclease